ncbi:transcriptional regulator [Opitutaceae bacterium TAV1]|nr:transcriptional regulator [Opitutaceae bacterium TAV1]
MSTTTPWPASATVPASLADVPPVKKAGGKKTPRLPAPPVGEQAAPVTGEQAEGRVNVYQVAERAGVSPGTVSRVLNNRGRVHIDTRKRVFDAARALGFRPQVQVRTKQVAVVSDNMWESMRNWGYYQVVWAHIAFALYKHNMTMVLPDTPEELRQRHVDGIIVVGEYPPIRPVLAELQKHTPVVLTDDFSETADHHWVVRSDQLLAGRLAAEQFIKSGRKRLGFVGSWGSQERVILAGYKEGMARAGLDCVEELFVMRNQEVTFYGAVSRVIRLGADAIFIPGSNYEGLEGLNVLSNVLRLQIPKDVALIGGEMHGVSEFLTPPMTTIEEPLAETANHAVATLTALMNGEQPPRRISLPVRLLVRESA